MRVIGKMLLTGFLCLLFLTIAACQNISVTSSGKMVKSTTTGDAGFNEAKIYEIPFKQRKKSYSIEDFKALLNGFDKLNNIKKRESIENDNTGMSEADIQKYYRIIEITPEKVKKEIGCQIFRINNSSDTFVVYKSKVYRIGFGFGGHGVVSIESCDFDGDKKKDLIYTFSWGSGMHRSHIGVLNLSNNREEWLDFMQLNEDVVLNKVSDDNFKVDIAKVTWKDWGSAQPVDSYRKPVAEVKGVNGKVEIIKY
jgi:hypothetical protein